MWSKDIKFNRFKKTLALSSPMYIREDTDEINAAERFAATDSMILFHVNP
jgi:hypothetical protein